MSTLQKITISRTAGGREIGNTVVTQPAAKRASKNTAVDNVNEDGVSTVQMGIVRHYYVIVCLGPSYAQPRRRVSGTDRPHLRFSHQLRSASGSMAWSW